MPRSKRPRLSWFRFYADDFRGGVSSMTATEVGTYVLLLCSQWDTKGNRKVPADGESLAIICHGVQPSDKVLAKFEPVGNDGKFIRNIKLSEEWESSQREYVGKSGRGKVNDTGVDTTPLTAPEPEPEPDIQQTTTTARAVARPERRAAKRVDRAEEATKAHVRKLQLALAEKLVALSEHENSRLMIPGWCKRVTSYDKSPGVSDYRMISSPERLEKSISDAEWWMSQLEGGRKVG